MARQVHEDREALDPRESATEAEYQSALRPRTFEEYIGQRDLMSNLRVFVQAALKRGEALDHILFAVDWPFVMNSPAVEWMAQVPISDADKAKILSGNAQRLLKM